MKRDPEIGGRRLERSLADFERSCLAHIGELMEHPSSNTGLIALLCDAVRLARECSDTGAPRMPVCCQCEVYETCDICRARTVDDLRRLRQRVNTTTRIADDGTQNDPHERLS